MPPSLSQDEFADLPDIVDFSAITLEGDSQGITGSQQTHAVDEFAEFDEYNEVDSFSGIDLDSVTELGPASAAATNPGQPEEPAQPAPGPTATSQRSAALSSQYDFDELDAEAFDMVDSIVRDAMAQDAQAEAPGSTLPSTGRAMSHFSCADSTRESTITNSQLSTRSSVKRKRSDIDSHPSLSKKNKGKGKGKGRADPHASARQILTGMEDSISCSICYHLFSEPHVATPCGHSFCGECIVGWIKQNIRTLPRCPVCRTALSQGSLIIPNFALKHSIEKHVSALAETGVVDWQPQGQRYLDWTRRNVRWLELARDVRDLQNRRWATQGDAPSQGGHLAEIAAIEIDLEELEEMMGSDDSSDDDSDVVYWGPT